MCSQEEGGNGGGGEDEEGGGGLLCCPHKREGKMAGHLGQGWIPSPDTGQAVTPTTTHHVCQ